MFEAGEWGAVCCVSARFLLGVLALTSWTWQSGLRGPVLAMTRAGAQDAASLAEVHALSFYDASWAAAARDLGIALISADRRLLSTGLAESPTEVTARLRLPLA